MGIFPLSIHPPPAVSLDSLFFFRGLRDTPTKRSQAHSLWDLMNHVIAGLAGLHASGNRDCMLQPACIGWPGGTLSMCGGWCQPDMPPRKKRKSATDGMSPAEQLESGVERGLIMVLDADTQSAELSEYWPGHPSSCEVVVCGPNGHPKYIRNITDRLETLGFVMGRLPHRPKRPRQPQQGWRRRTSAARPRPSSPPTSSPASSRTGSAPSRPAPSEPLSGLR